MRLLLDTHALLWWLNDDEKLGNHARRLIGDPENDVLVSAVSLWEITVKLRIGKLDADIEEIVAILPDQGFDRLDITDGGVCGTGRNPTLAKNSTTNRRRMRHVDCRTAFETRSWKIMVDFRAVSQTFVCDSLMAFLAFA